MAPCRKGKIYMRTLRTNLINLRLFSENVNSNVAKMWNLHLKARKQLDSFYFGGRKQMKRGKKEEGRKLVVCTNSCNVSSFLISREKHIKEKQKPLQALRTLKGSTFVFGVVCLFIY